MLASLWALDGGLSKPSAPTEARGIPPLISLHEFWSNSTEKWNFQISPDGTHLAWLGDYKDESAILYKKLDEDDLRAIRLARPLEEFWWAEDSRRLLFSWDEFGDENYHLLLADTEHPEAPYVDLTPHPGVAVFFHQQFASDPTHLLIQHNRRDRSLFDLYRLDIETREETLVAENPGDVLSWITNPRGKVLARRRQVDDASWHLEVYDEDADAWKVGFSSRDESLFSIVGYPRNTREALALSGRGRDRTSLVRINLETGQEKVLYEHPEVDVEYAFARAATNELVAAYACPDYWRVKYFDPELAKMTDRFHGGDRTSTDLFDWSRDERFWIITTESDTQDLAWYLYDREKGQERTLSASDLPKHRDHMAATQPIEFAAQDGLLIRGYLTVPVGSTGTDLPMVIKVHDGPGARAEWGFSRETQFFANRGYAVLEVNFRGSTGYGKDFVRAGFGEFASAMHSDILDALSWAIAEGVADPERVAIYGWGYGGYEALVALSYTPDVFAAAIDGAGPADWEQVLTPPSPLMQSRQLALQAYLGDPSTREGLEALRSASPIHRVDQIVRPLLVVQGGNDAWEIQDQVEDLVARLQERNAPIEYLFLEKEGRSIQNWENQLRFYRALETFLAKHLGGRVSPITADEMWIGLRKGSR